MRTELGELIRRARDERGLSQRELAAEAGISSGSVAHIETGRIQDPGPETVARLVRYLGLTYDQVNVAIGRSVEPRPQDLYEELRRINLLPENRRARALAMLPADWYAELVRAAPYLDNDTTLRR